MESKQSKIDRTKANLPLPEQPPVASDWQSMDATTVNIGAEKKGSEPGPKEPPVNPRGEPEDLSQVGRQGKEMLETPPKDAAY